MLVTDLKKIDSKRWCLYLDYEPFGPVYKSDIKRYKLVVGDSVDEDKINVLKDEHYPIRAMNKVVAALQYADKCEFDIRKKLKDLSFNEDIIDSTVNKLKEFNYIDDGRYARIYVQSHMNKKSRKEIYFALAQKKISEDIIDAAFEECGAPSEEDVLAAILLKKYGVETMKNSRQKVMAAMCRRGFKPQLVAQTVESLTGE